MSRLKFNAAISFACWIFACFTNYTFITAGLSGWVLGYFVAEIFIHSRIEGSKS